MKYLEHYSYKQLFKTSSPVVVMLLFTSVYGLVDGLFVSNFVGKSGFTALNLIMPYLLFFGGIGFIFGRGGSALIAKILGEKKYYKANQIFTTLVLVAFLTGVITALLGYFCLPLVTKCFGATGDVYNNAIQYGSIYLLGNPFLVIQIMFESLYSTAGKQKLGLYSTVICGVMNMVMDLLLIVVFGLGLRGAAYATIFSQFIGAFIPIIFFARENDSMLQIIKCKYNFHSMKKVCTNGLSEMLNNVTFTIVSILYNIQLLKYGGDDAVSAYGVMMYVGFLFNSMIYGFVTAVSPLISYNYGADNKIELKSLLKKSIVIIMVESLSMFILANILNPIITGIFVGYDEELLSLTRYEFKVFSLWFLVNGLALFGSSFFTALNDGVLSAFLSFMRIVIFQIPAVILLPIWFSIDGIFISQAVAEMLTIMLNMIFILKYSKEIK